MITAGITTCTKRIEATLANLDFKREEVTRKEDESSELHNVVMAAHVEIQKISKKVQCRNCFEIFY